MAIHKVEIILKGYFEISDGCLKEDYQASTIQEAVANQRGWLEDEGDIISFVADTIEGAELTLNIVGKREIA